MPEVERLEALSGEPPVDPIRFFGKIILVPAQHAVWMVAAPVETLDVSGFAEPIKGREGVAGRDATDPGLLVGLWLYACIRGIGSARELARRCEESAAFRWLCGE